MPRKNRKSLKIGFAVSSQYQSGKAAPLMAKEDKKASKDLVGNRRAFHDYEILETFEAGLALQGTEIKSLRANGGSLQEAYVRVLGGELWLIGATIAPYKFGNIYNHEDKRERKLLLHKREIVRLSSLVKEKGITIVPLAIYLNARGMAKIKIATAKGKKLHDKRAALKAKEDKRRVDQALKEGG